MKRAWLMSLMWAVSCSQVQGPPNGEVQIERAAVTNSFATGSLIVPMDNTFQNDGMLKAYGLVYKLLSNGIPVHWAVRGDKTANTAVDFAASAQDLTTMNNVSAMYRGGPFIIDSAQAAAATPLITAWLLSNPSVHVHRATADFSADVTEVLRAAPRVAVFEDDNEDIAFGVLNGAGIPDSAGNAWASASPDVLTVAEISGPTSGGTTGDGALLRSDGTPAYHFLASMHWDQPVGEVVREVRVWLDASALSHAYMQCNAVNAFENNTNGRYLTTGGVGQETQTTCILIICSTSDLNPPNPVVNRAPADVFDQYDGTLTLDTGSLQSMGLANGSSFKTGVKVLLAGTGSGNTRLAFVRGNLDGSASNGIVSYLTGHDYSTTTPVSSNPLTNGARLMLNALFASSVAGTSGQPNVSLTKSGVALTRSPTVTWTINYTNSAGAGVAESAVIEDVLPAGTTLVSSTPAAATDGGSVSWQLGSLAPGETGSVSVTVNVAGDGAYVNQAKLRYQVGLTAGEVSSNPSSTTVDTTPPDGVISSTPPARSNDPTPDFTFSSSETSTYECSLDGAAGVTCPASYTVSPALTDGAHTLTVTAIDTAGNRDPSPATYTWVTDTQAPAAPVISTPATGDTTSAQPTISGTAEPGSLVAVSVDGNLLATVNADANTGAWSYTVTPAQALNSGSHTVSATAQDQATNVSAAASNTFTVDTSAPGAPVITAPANGSFTNTQPVTVTGTASPGFTVHVVVDGQPEVQVTADNTTGAWSLVLPAQTEAQHTVRATQSATPAGTQGAAAVSVFTVDTTAPVAPVITAPVNGSTIGTQNPDVRGTAEPFSTVTLSVDGGGPLTVTADADGNWHYVLPALSEAQHTVTATATDRAGNVSGAASTTFTVDKTPPGVPVITAPTGVTNDATPTVVGTTDVGTTVQVFVDGVFVGNATADASGNWSYTLTTALSDGTHQLSASAIDTAGNASAQSMPVTVVIDTQAPAAPLVLTPGAGTATNQATPTVSGTAEPGATVTVNIDGNVVGQATADSTGAWSLPTTATLVDGEHHVTTTATDTAGNTGSPSADVTFTVDTLSPGKPVIITPAMGAMTTSTPTFTGTAEPNALVAIIIDGQTVATVQANGSGDWLYTPGAPLVDGSHTVTARATDAAGNASPDADAITFTSSGGSADGGTDGGMMSGDAGVDDGGTGTDGGMDDGGTGSDGGTGFDGGTHSDGGSGGGDAGVARYDYSGGGIGCSAAGVDFSMVALGVLTLLRRRRRA